MADVLVLAAHPQLEDSRVNRALMDAAAALGAQHVTLRDLYALYPDYVIDVDAEQAEWTYRRMPVGSRRSTMQTLACVLSPLTP